MYLLTITQAFDYVYRYKIIECLAQYSVTKLS